MTTTRTITCQVGDVKFVKEFGGLSDQEVTDKWVSEDGKFELTRQAYHGGDDGTGDPDLESDWGVWDVEGDEWAHVPAETGFNKRRDAEAAFIRWQKETS